MQNRLPPDIPAVILLVALLFIITLRLQRRARRWLAASRPRHILIPGVLSQIGVMLYNIHTGFADLFPALWLMVITFGFVTLRAQARAPRYHLLGG